MNAPTSRQLGGASAWIIWCLVTLFEIYKLTTQTAYAVINASVAESLSLSLARIGFLGSVYAFAFALVTIPTGALLDRFGARVTLSAAAAIVAIGALVFSMADSWAMVVTGQILMGVGGAFAFPGAGYLIRHWFPVALFGIMFGLFEAAASVTTAFMQGSMGFLILRFDWRTIVLFGAVAGVILTVALPLVIRDPQEVLSRSDVSTASFWKGFVLALKEVIGNRTLLAASVYGGLAWSVGISIAVLWGIKILTVRGFDETTASTINASIWLGFAAGSPLVAVFANTLKSYKRTSYTFMTGLLLLVLWLLYAPDLSIRAAYVTFILTGFFAAVSLVPFMMTAEICRDVVTGTAMAFVNMIMFLLSGFMMSVPARLLTDVELNLSALQDGLMILPGGLLLGIVFLYFLREPYGSAVRQ